MKTTPYVDATVGIGATVGLTTDGRNIMCCSLLLGAGISLKY